MAFKRPDIYVSETLALRNTDTNEGATATPVFVGEAGRGPVVPTLVSNFTEFTNTFGSLDQSPFLAFAVYQYFLQGGGPCVINRVAGSGSAAATRSIADGTASPAVCFTVTAKNPGAWGNGLSISISTSLSVTTKFDLVVNLGGADDSYTVERFNGLSMTPGDPRFLDDFIFTYSNYISTAVVSSLTPATQAASPLAGGLDGSPVTSTQTTIVVSALAALEATLLIAIPGCVDPSVYLAAVSVVEGSGRGFVVADCPKGGVAADIKTFATSMPTSSYIGIYGPWLLASDPTKTVTSRPRLVPPSGAVMGSFAVADSKFGPYRAPAGEAFALAGVVDVEARFTNSLLDDFNAAIKPVNIIRPLTNRGICIMGSRTLDPRTAAKYVPVRRSLTYIRESLRELLGFALFAPNDARLWAQITDVCTAFLGSYYALGGLAGATEDAAFFVNCDATTNTPLSVSNGEVNVKVGVAIEFPAEFIVIQVGLFEGGSTISDATVV